MTASHGEPTAFLGLSHLGLVSAIGWASLGHPVVALDSDAGLVAALAEGRLPIHEPGLLELLPQNREWLRFSTDFACLVDCPLVVVARDVPTDEHNVSDPTAVLELVDRATPHLRSGVALVVMSQVPPGFTRALAAHFRTRRPDLAVSVYYWVETLVVGDAVERFLRPERLIIGSADPDAAVASVFARRLEAFRCPVLRMSYESAELAKTAINLYLSAAVTFANTMSDLCEALGANWGEMLPALRLDRRIGPAAYIRPGLGIAGGNLERDLVTLRQLCDSSGVDGTLIEALLSHNARRYHWVHRKLREHVFKEVSHPVVAVWGLAYKRNTRSTKNSLALRLIRELSEISQLRAYDPVVGAADLDMPLRLATDAQEAAVGADCLLILTDWDEFAVPRPEIWRMMRRPVVIDGVGVVDPARADLEGVRYVSMGRPASR